MNCYATPQQAGFSDIERGLLVLSAASRTIDAATGRVFSVANETRYFDGTPGAWLMVGDVLSISSVALDTDMDETYSTVIDSNEYALLPDAHYPAERLRLKRNAAIDWVGGSRHISVVGVWGAGDMARAHPFDVTATLVTADSSSTTVVLSSSDSVLPGHTVLVDNEQMFVRNVTVDSESGNASATVDRAVNGTTTAVHVSSPVMLASYPSDVVQATLVVTTMLRNFEQGAGLSSETIDGYRYSLAQDHEIKGLVDRLVSRVRKWPL